MQKNNSTEKPVEKAVLVALSTAGQSTEKAKEYLNELAFLASTLGVETLKTFTQKVDRPDPRTFVGKGKAEEIREYVKAARIDLVVFDDDLSPTQLRNLEKIFECRIYDRSLLILDIFLKRAQTAQAKTQVELARYQYLMPRLTRMWTHLERQRGGTGTRGGAGEKEIETDKRVIRDQISVLKEKLEKIDKQSATQRKSRQNVVRVALVGYTNVGKSTLMNLLTKSNVYAENKLFATVDATVRKVVWENIPFLLSDTVGFIRKLPHHLIESFKSTLQEVKESDVLLHVVDVSHPAHVDQMEVVNSTLAELGAAEKPVIYVFNKIDRWEELQARNVADDELDEDATPPTLEQLKDSLFFDKASKNDSVFISATESMNIDDLRSIILSKVKDRHYTIFPNYLKNETY
ncbi:MAG: GTPase HflX [Cyclobacteriaceae bacterium]